MGSPIFFDYRANPNMIDLINQGGQAQADFARRQAEMFAGAFQGVGQAVGGAIQQHQEQKQQSKNERALRDAIYSWDDNDPQGSAMRLVQVAGPKGLEYAKTFQSLRENVQSKDPKTNLQGAKAAVTFFNDDTPEGKAKGYQRLLQTLAPTGSFLGIDPTQVPPEYGPEAQSFLDRFVKGADTFLGTKLETPDKPKLTYVTVPGPNGTKVRKGFTDEQMAGGVEEFVEAPKPEKAEKSLAEKVAEARAISAAHAQGAASVKANQPGEEFTFNPEGVVLSSYGQKQKNEARRQATERGLPVFENTTTQTKGVQLAGIVAEAKELKALLEDEDVAAVVGPALSNPVKALRRASGGLVDLPPNAQRALQLAGMLSDSELRKRSGASAGDPEMKRILGFAVSPTMPLGNLKTNLGGMLKAAARDYKALSGIDIGFPDEAPTGGSPVQIKDEAEYSRLPEGARYITPDGRLKRKGNR